MNYLSSISNTISNTTNLGSVSTMNTPFVVKVIEARGLKDQDVFTKSDPYVIVKMKGLLSHGQKSSVKNVSNYDVSIDIDISYLQSYSL